MKKTTQTLLFGIFVVLVSASALAHRDIMHNAEDAKKLKLENLMSAQLEGAKGTEVIVSRVAIPPNTMLPKHWHPGEEFAYIIDGSVVLWQKGKKDTLGKKGDALKVPLKQIHTARTEDEGVVLLVFRVHEQGQPERFKAD